MPLHKTVIWRCPSKIRDAVCDHPFSCFRNNNFCRYRKSLFLLSVIHFFTSASRSSHFAYSYEKSIYSSLTSLAPPFPCIIFSVGGGSKCLLAIFYYHAVSHTVSHLILNLKYTKSLSKNILKTYFFSTSSLSLHATEQLVQETMNCFSCSKDE
jgi:hypothetical protein